MLALMVSFVSALTLSEVSSDDFTYEGQVQNITISGDVAFSLTLPSNSFSVTPSSSGTDTSSTFNFTLNTLPTIFEVNTFTVTATAADDSTDTFDLTYAKTFCSKGARYDGNDDVSSNATLEVRIDNNGEGDDNTWQPLDNIEVKVKLKNDNDGVDLDNVIFEIGLYKTDSASNVIDDMQWISKDDEEVEVGDIDAGDSETYTFEFIVDPAEIDDSDYYLVVKAYPDGEESDTCIDYSSDFKTSDFGSTSKYTATISIDKENDKDKMVVVDTSSYPVAIEAFCGANVLFTPDVWNVGDTNFEDQIKVTLYNQELGLNIEDVILGDFDAGDSATASFSFTVPEDASAKTYVLIMEAFYDYDKDDDAYDRSSDDTFRANLVVSGNCGDISASAGSATVSAALESGGKAGENMVVRAVVTNTGTASATYAISAAGYSSWASSGTANPGTLTLNKGEVGTVQITLAVKDDASGNQGFNIEVVSGNQLVVTQPVTVSVEGKGGFSFLTGAAIKDNAYLWGIGLLNLILIVAIIIVAVRVMRK